MGLTWLPIRRLSRAEDSYHQRGHLMVGGEQSLALRKKVAPCQWALGSDNGPVLFTKVDGDIGRD